VSSSETNYTVDARCRVDAIRYKLVCPIYPDSVGFATAPHYLNAYMYLQTTCITN
jgi:hypothetical protein